MKRKEAGRRGRKVSKAGRVRGGTRCCRAGRDGGSRARPRAPAGQAFLGRSRSTGKGKSTAGSPIPTQPRRRGRAGGRGAPRRLGVGRSPLGAPPGRAAGTHHQPTDRRPDGIGFGCREKASRGQRADMPTAHLSALSLSLLPIPRPRSDDRDARLRRRLGTPAAWSRILTSGSHVPPAPPVSRIGTPGVGTDHGSSCPPRPLCPLWHCTASLSVCCSDL